MSTALAEQSLVRSSSKSKRRIRPERVVDIALEDSQPPPYSHLHTGPSRTVDTHANHNTAQPFLSNSNASAAYSSRTGSDSSRVSRPLKTIASGGDGKRKRDSQEEETKEEPAVEEEDEAEGEADAVDGSGVAPWDDADEEGSQLEERKESDSRTTKKPIQATVDPSAPPLIPFIFNPSHLPSDADRAASAKVVQNRLAEFLNGVELVDKTTAMQRAKMSKDRLLQRNLEIQSMMFYFDRDYDALLNDKPLGWESAVRLLDEKNDALAEESDEIETLLFEKFRVVGGGRSLLSDEIVQAANYGASMADSHRQRGLPIPKLSAPITLPGSKQNEEVYDRVPMSAASSTSRTAELLPAAAADEDEEMATGDASKSTGATAAASTDAPLKYSKKSRADAAVIERLDAAQKATTARRAERKEKEKDSLLGQYMQHFDKFIDVDRVVRTSTKRGKAPARPSNFTVYLGTCVFPLYGVRDGIKLDREEIGEHCPQEESKSNVDLKEEKSMSATEAASSTDIKRSRKRAHSHSGPSSVALIVESDDESVGEEEVDDAEGEPVWLDFTRDSSYIDGCLVKQVQPATDGGSEETATLGLLPLQGLMPHQEEDQPEYDEEGELISARKRSKRMPEPSHALAALYILHEAGLVRLDSSLVRASPSAASSSSAGEVASIDRVEVAVLVNSRIYDQQLLRSIAQKEALRTLFRLFSGKAPILPQSRTPALVKPSLYENSLGDRVPYSQLTDGERKTVAYSDRDDAPPATEEKVVDVQQESGVVPMDIDFDCQKTKHRRPILVKNENMAIIAAPSAAAAASSSVSIPQQSSKRRKIESGAALLLSGLPRDDDTKQPTASLSLRDSLIADGEEIGDSENEEMSDQGSEDDEDEDAEADSEDELFDTFEGEQLVFVNLSLPAPADASDAEMQPMKSDSTSSSAAPAEQSTVVMSAEEISSLRSIEKKSAELDAKAHGSAKRATPVEMTQEDCQLESESKAIWRPDTLHSLFESIRPTPAWTRAVAQPTGLLSTLRPFQQKALAWMMEREKERDEEYDDPLWEEGRLNGRTVWYQPYLGLLQKQRPEKRKDFRGAILADEMGLGKTVCVIALVLKNSWAGAQALSPRQSAMVKREYAEDIPEDRAASLPRIGATLIVSPMSLVYQWQKEIQLHAPSLRVLIYDGVKQLRSPAEQSQLFELTMQDFSEADVILTNYAVLGQEVNYSKQCAYSFRGEKQYQVPKSPLLDCHFHRVVLDEAQMVHSALSICFQMASRIVGSSRFCVSGTPIGPQGLADLYGLVSFLGCQEYASVTTWRAAMRCNTSEGLERLRHLLKRIMWRHAKAHVLDEVCIPRLHLNKVYLSFSKVERAYYQRAVSECRSKVFFSTVKGEVEDRTALKKLESLRMAATHPLASSNTFLGKSYVPMPDIGKALVKRVQDEAAQCERDLARALNKLALEYRRQGEPALAEQTFAESWRIADSGVIAETQNSNGGVTAAAMIRNRSSTDAIAAAVAAATISSKSLDTFDTDTNIVTQNSQVRQWRMIELVTCFHLAGIYREQLKKQHGIDVEPLTSWRETGAQMFDRIMATTLAMQSAYAEDGASSAQVAQSAGYAAEAASKALPPQLLAGAAASSSSAAAADASSSSATMDVDFDSSEHLIRKFKKQKEQFDYTLHDLFDLQEEKLTKQAVLIWLTYEAHLLPGYLKNSTEEVERLCEERQQIGVEEFNRLSKPYLRRSEELLFRCDEEKKTFEIVLTLYELNRSKLLVEELVELLQNRQRRALQLEVMTQLRSVLKAKLKSTSYYPSFVRAPPKNMPAENKKLRVVRTFDEQLKRTLSQLQGSITKRMRQLAEVPALESLRIEKAKASLLHVREGEHEIKNEENNEGKSGKNAKKSASKKKKGDSEHAGSASSANKPPELMSLADQLLSENDMVHRDFAQSKFYAAYDFQWRQSRDSTQALRILKEVKLQRSKMRTYIQKLLAARLILLRDQHIISEAESKESGEKLEREVHLEEEDSDGGNAAAGADDHRASPKKRQKKDSAASAAVGAGSPMRDVESDEDTDHVRGASARALLSTDTAVSRYDLNANVLSSLQREIKFLQTRAKQIHGKGHFLKESFGQLSSDERVRDRECAICHEVIIEPSLTSCGHYFDAFCLAEHLKKAQTPSCPICRAILGPEDYRSFSIDELPAAVRYEGEVQEKSTTAPRRSGSYHADVSSSTVPASAAAAAAAAVASSSGAAAAATTPSSRAPLAHMPSLEDIRNVNIIGEGQHGSKIETICRYIKHMHSVDPSVKVLVFSQYHRMLEFVGTALFHNNIHSLHLAGTPLQRAKQIDQFQTDPKYTVFLMSLRTDNSGLTLVNATAVFLIEPSLNPSVEAQAVNRVHRIGQTSETVVFKFLMRDSVEQAIDELTTSSQGGSEPVQSGGESLAQQSKETLSVSQLLSVLDLADDKPSADVDEAEDTNAAAAATSNKHEE